MLEGSNSVTFGYWDPYFLEGNDVEVLVLTTFS